MAFPVAAAIGAGIGALGNILSGSSNARQSERNYKHRYQWEVQDLKKAGLNPALAYGHNAPIPATQPLEPLGDSAVKGAQATSSASQAAAQKDLVKAQTQLLRAQSADLIESVKIKNALMFTQTAQSGASAGLTIKQQEIAEETLRGLQMDNRWKEGTLDQRIFLLKRALELKGVELDRAQLELQLRRLDENRLKAESAFFGATGGVGSTNAIQLLRLLGGLLR